MLRDRIIEIFVKVDDFCREFGLEIRKHQLDGGSYRVRDRKPSLSESEIIAILIALHNGHFTNIKHFYLEHICLYYKDYFPNLVSYSRFIELQQRVAVPMMLFLKTQVQEVSTSSILPTLKYATTGVSITTKYLLQ